MDTSKKNIFITGGRGFIAKNLIEYLTQDYSKIFTVFYPLHSELELLNTESVLEFVNQYKIDIIIHCASVGGSRKTGYDQDKTDVVYRNERMFFNLVNTLGKERQMIFLGSGAEYDRKNYKPKMNEEYFGVHIPEDAYGFSKYVCARFIEKSTNIINLRLFGVFGRHEDYLYRFISNSIVKNLFHLPIVINQNVNFDYLYVNDLSKIIVYFLQNHAKFCSYNVVPGKMIDLLTIAHKINSFSEKPSEIVIKNSGLNIEYSADNSRLMKELKNFSFTSFDQALGELYNWYKNNIDKLDKKAIEEDPYIQYCRVKE